MVTEAKDFLVTGKQDPKLNLAECLALVKKQHGKSLFSQVGDVFRFVYRGHRLGLDEYYYYKLYDDQKFTRDQKAEFLGKKAQTTTISACSAASYRGLAHDKLIFQAILDSMGAPCPKPVAILHPQRKLHGVPSFNSPQTLAAFLREQGPFPFFAKPIRGMWSVGTVAAESLNQDDELLLPGGQAVPLDDFCAKLGTVDMGGYLLQELVKPHDALAETCGQGLSTLRMIVMLWEKGPELFQVVGKLIGGGNTADNFWRQGNLLADIDRENGIIKRAVQGVGPYQQELSEHPDTHKPLQGFTWPHFEAAKDLVLDLSRNLPDIKLQAWDIAVGPQGPCVIELNIGGDFNLPQIAADKGLMGGHFKKFVDYCKSENLR